MNDKGRVNHLECLQESTIWDVWSADKRSGGHSGGRRGQWAVPGQAPKLRRFVQTGPGPEGGLVHPAEAAVPEVAVAGQLVGVAPPPVEVEPLEVRAGEGVGGVDQDEVEPRPPAEAAARRVEQPRRPRVLEPPCTAPNAVRAVGDE